MGLDGDLYLQGARLFSAVSGRLVVFVWLIALFALFLTTGTSTKEAKTKDMGAKHVCIRWMPIGLPDCRQAYIRCDGVSKYQRTHEMPPVCTVQTTCEIQSASHARFRCSTNECNSLPMYQVQQDLALTGTWLLSVAGQALTGRLSLVYASR